MKARRGDASACGHARAVEGRYGHDRLEATLGAQEKDWFVPNRREGMKCGRSHS